MAEEKAINPSPADTLRSSPPFGNPFIGKSKSGIFLQVFHILHIICPDLDVFSHFAIIFIQTESSHLLANAAVRYFVRLKMENFYSKKYTTRIHNDWTSFAIQAT